MLYTDTYKCLTDCTTPNSAIHIERDSRAFLSACHILPSLLWEVYSAWELHLTDGCSALLRERANVTRGKYYCRTDLCLKVFQASVFCDPPEILTSSWKIWPVAGHTDFTLEGKGCKPMALPVASQPTVHCRWHLVAALITQSNPSLALCTALGVGCVF